MGHHLYSGGEGRVFELHESMSEEVKSKKVVQKSSYIIKLSEKYENIANEIKIMKKIKKFQNEEVKTSLPNLVEYGCITFQNLNECDMEDHADC